MNQNKMPFVEALEKYKKKGFMPFHTPGHKIGHQAPEPLKKWMGPALPYDLGLMYAMDDLHEPEGVLKEAQDLAAELYGANQAWFSINGTTALIETMIMGSVGPGDTIIIPREAHRSVVSGLILSGAKPVYLSGRFDSYWGISLGTTLDEIKMTIKDNPEAKALLLVYPNYYGVGVDIKAIVEEAHKHGLLVLVDEAHGPHLPFSEDLPIEALEAGADLVAQSTHKLLGSLTQTSILLGQGIAVDYRRITQVHQMLQSTSPNYIFLASLDMARHQVAKEGKDLVGKAVLLSNKLRQRLNKIPGISVMNQEDLQDVANFDVTKVLIDCRGLGLTGIEFEKKLRQKKIEVELIQASHVLVLITIGDSEESIAVLVKAVEEISQEVIYRQSRSEPRFLTHQVGNVVDNRHQLPFPKVIITPREAFYKTRKQVFLKDAIGYISGETISYYPPGIPFVCMGEEITESVVSYIEQKQIEGYRPNGVEDSSLSKIWVLDNRG